MASNRLRTKLCSWGFHQSRVDTSLFFFRHGMSIVWLLTYVDDILITRNDNSMINSCIQRLHHTFALKHLEPVSYFLGVEVIRHTNDMHLNQSRYIRELLERTKMSDCKPSPSPPAPRSNWAKTVGTQCLILASIAAQSMPYSICLDPSGYLFHCRQITSSYATSFGHPLGCMQTCYTVFKSYCNSRHSPTCFLSSSVTGVFGCRLGSSVDDRRSTGGHCIYLSDNLVSWSAKKQQVVARSSTESEYCALANCAADHIWIISLLRELRCFPSTIPVIWCDNYMNAGHLEANSVFHARTKHIKIDVHFVRGKELQKKLNVRFIPSDDRPPAVSWPRSFHARSFWVFGPSSLSPNLPFTCGGIGM